MRVLKVTATLVVILDREKQLKKALKDVVTLNLVVSILNFKYLINSILNIKNCITN